MNRIAALLLTLALSPLAVGADPPGRVGRLSWTEGEVSVFADPDRGWEGALVNSHLTSENSVWTEPGARAEVRVGATALRLDEATQLDLVRLDDNQLLAHVVRGRLALRVRYFERGDAITVTTPVARFQVRGNGRYRIDAEPDNGGARLTVFEGDARLEAAGGYVHVDAGRAVRVYGGNRPGYEFEDGLDTSLDDWARARDSVVADGPAARYVSPRMTGWEDLDAYGEWREEPEYGVVWYPARVAADWAPYRYGRWTWVRPWGWTWVDEAPWGYAPFHYGRWAFIGNRWGWYPGRYERRPVWAPALVGWVGQPGWNLSVSSGPLSVMGWFPLSPFDRYEPWYRANPAYVGHLNTVVIANRRPPPHFVHNRDYGATVVSRDYFLSHRPVQGGLARVPRDVLAAQPIGRGVNVLPSHDEWRSRPRPPEGRPPAHGPRPGEPPLVKPQPAPSALPGQPAPQPHRPGRPLPPDAQSGQVKPPPAGMPPPRPMVQPGFAPGQTSQPQPPVAKPVPPDAAPGMRPPGQEPRRGEPPRGPENRGARQGERPPGPAAMPPGGPAPSAQPGTRPADRPAPQAAPRPADRPPPAPAARPQERSAPPASAPPVEKPGARGGDRPSGRGSDRPDKPDKP